MADPVVVRQKLKESIMVSVKKSDDGKVATVNGSEADVMLFYCFWQTSLWPDWMKHKKLGQENDAATRQHKAAIADVNAGKGIVLSNSGDQFESALQFAVGQCRALGIEVSGD